MNSQYSQTWKQISSPAELILADFDNAHKHISTKKVVREIVILLFLFVLFSFSLSWADKQLAVQQDEDRMLGINNESQQTKEFDQLYEIFYQGYVGQSFLNNYGYSLEVNKKIEEIKNFENLI